MEATACFPLIVAATFAKDACSDKSEEKPAETEKSIVEGENTA